MKPLSIIAGLMFFYFQSFGQAPRFIFLDSLTYNISPVSSNVVRSQGYTRTESFTIRSKEKDTLQHSTFFYDALGRTRYTLYKHHKTDTLTIEFSYDELNRVVKRKGIKRGRQSFASISEYINDTLKIKDINYYGKQEALKVLVFNPLLQLLHYTVYDSTGKQVQVTNYEYNRQLLPERVIQTTGSRTSFDNLYEHHNNKGGRIVKIYEMFGGYKRLIEKIVYNSKGQLIKTISYDYYYKSKKFTAELEYNTDGSIKLYKGMYHYSGYSFKQYFFHYKD